MLWMEQLPNKLGPTIPELREEMSTLKPIKKNVFSCVRNEEFLNGIKKIKPKRIYLAGIETHVCVYQTAIDLLELGYHVEIIVDAVSSRNELNMNIGLERISDAGGKNTTIETLFFEHLQIAEGDQFRQIINLIK